MVALASHNTHSSVALGFHNPLTLVLEGVGFWKVGGPGVRRPLFVVPALHTSLSLSTVDEEMAGGLCGESLQGRATLCPVHGVSCFFLVLLRAPLSSP